MRAFYDSFLGPEWLDAQLSLLYFKLIKTLYSAGMEIERQNARIQKAQKDSERAQQEYELLCAMHDARLRSIKEEEEDA